MYKILKGVKISISTDMNVDNECIPGYSQNKAFWTPAAHLKVTFSLFLETISKQYESFECFYQV